MTDMNERKPKEQQSRSYRPQRVAEAVRRALGMFFLTEARIAGFRDASMGITAVQMSPDLRNATVYVRMPAARSKLALRELQGAVPACRRHLAEVLLLRCVPDLHFVYDKVAERAGRLDSLLRTATKPATTLA